MQNISLKAGASRFFLSVILCSGLAVPSLAYAEEPYVDESIDSSESFDGESGEFETSQEESPSEEDISDVGELENDETEARTAEELEADEKASLDQEAGETAEVAISQTREAKTSNRDELDVLAAQHRDDLPDGIYLIRTALTNKHVLDVASGSKANSANVRLYTSNMTPAQKWRVSHDKKGYVTLVNIKSGKALDVAGGRTANGTNVAQYASNNTPAQKWIAIDVGGGVYRVVAALMEGVSLDVAGGKSANGSNVQVYKTNGTKAQNFVFMTTTPAVDPCENVIEEGYYTLGSSVDPSFVVDVAGGKDANGVNVQLYKANATNAQLFRFVYRSGYYQIVNVATERVLDVAGGNLVPGTNVQTWAGSTGSKNQLFSARENPDGTFVFINAATGLALDVSGGKPKNSVNLQGFTPNGTAAQSFVLSRRTDLLSEGLYSIRSALGSNVLDVKGGSSAEAANVQMYARNNTLAQKWSISRVEGLSNTYTFRSVLSGRYLVAENSGNVCQRAATDGFEYWKPAISKGAFVLTNVKTGKVLDVAGGSKKSGANVQVYRANGTTAQRFSFVKVDPLATGTYVVRSAADAKKVVDVKGGSYSSSANVQLYSSNDSGAQKWEISKNSDGTYTVVNAKSNKALDVQGGKAASGTNVQQYAKNGSKAQRWRLVYNEDGTFRLASALDGSLALSVEGDSVKNGANVCVKKYEGSKAQKFTFSKTSYVEPMTARQRAVVDATYSVKSPGLNWCALWVSRVYEAAGWSYPSGNACDMYWKWCKSSNRSALKPGMLVATAYSPTSDAGKKYGHVSIYIGNNKVRESRYGSIRTTDLDDWIKQYSVKYPVKWGFPL